MAAAAQRLRACWYGPLFGSAVLAFSISIPAFHYCYGIESRFPYPADPMCGWRTGITALPGATLVLPALLVLVLLALQLVSSDGRWLVAIGAVTALLSVGFDVFVLPEPSFQDWLSRNGIDARPYEAGWELLFMLPAGLLPLLAGIRRLRRA